MGVETPNCPSPWDFVILPEEDRATAIGNMHIKIGKDRACGSRDMLSDRETHRRTDRQTDVLITILRRRFRGRSNHGGLRGSASPVLTATGLVNGRWQFSTPLQNRHPLTDRQKLVTGDYVGDPCIGAKFGAHPSTGASGRMGEI